MKDFVKLFLKFLLVITGALALGIVVVSLVMFGTSDGAAFTRYKDLVSSALLPAFTAMLTFIGGAGVLNALVQAANNAVLVSKGQAPQPVEMFSWL